MSRLGDCPREHTQGHTRGLAGRKRSLTEGGIRMPTLMEWPAMITRNHNLSWPGVSNDLLPTLLEVFGVQVRPYSYPGRKKCFYSCT